MASKTYSFLTEINAVEGTPAFKFLIQEKSKRVRQLLQLYRGQIIDSAELYAGNTELWTSLRSRLLNLLGEKGLERAILIELVRPSSNYQLKDQSSGGEQ
jgi:hypothetical protein